MARPILNKKYMYKVPESTFDILIPKVDEFIHWCHVCGEYADPLFRFTLPPFTKKEKREDTNHCDYELKNILICTKCIIDNSLKGQLCQ